MTGLWDDAEVLSTYTRAQAIEDGVLTPVEALVPDEPDFARSVGWKFPIAMTASVVALVRPTEREAGECAQDLKGRLWDVLSIGAWAARMAPGDADTIYFSPIFQLAGRAEYRDGRKHQAEVPLKMVVGPGDDWEPVATLMLRSES